MTFSSPTKRVFHLKLGLLCLSLFILPSAWAQFTFEQKSEPPGIISTATVTYESNASVNSPSIGLISGGYAFTHWELNGARMEETNGSSLTNFAFLINSNSVAIAHYLEITKDFDNDQVADWYEVRHLGSLENNQSHDFDGDGISLLQEYRFELNPTISDLPSPGGVSRRRSQTTFVNLGGARKLTLSSDPPGLVASEISYPEVNSTFTSASLSSTNGGYYFSHWEINGIRATDDVGIGLSQVSELMDVDKQIVAKYFEQNQDEDADGIPDWYEWHTFGTLENGNLSDSDLDSIPLFLERKFGFNGAITDSFQAGGVSRRRSAMIPVNLGGAFRVTQYSSPSGLIPTETILLENNSSYSTATLSGISHGYYFSHWEINGQRVADTSGIGLGTASTIVDESKEIVAKFFDQYEDLDADRIPDWFEWKQFGSLSFGEQSDPDEDGISVALERKFGLSSVIFDNFSSGGVSRRRSGETGFIFDPNGVSDSDGDGLSNDLESTIGSDPDMVDSDGDGYDDFEEFQAGTDPASASSMPNQPPSNLLPSSDLFLFENQPVGTIVSQFRATDLDGDELTYSLVSGTGDQNNSLFIMENNGTLRTQVVFDYETNASSYSIRVEARDILHQSIEGNFTIYLLDVDDTRPIVVLNGDVNVSHKAGVPYFDANATWTDAVDGSGIVIGQGHVDVFAPGSYELTYDYTDAAGNAAETVIRRVNVLNQAPHDLSAIGILRIPENTPYGTVVAGFSSTDNDEDSILTYNLLEEKDVNGSLASGAFYLESNGTLHVAKTFDYEIDPRQYLITIRASDQFGAYLEKTFSVFVDNVIEDLDGDNIEDHYDADDDGDGFADTVELAYGHDPRDMQSRPLVPIVQTMDWSLDENLTYSIAGEVLSGGGAPLLSYGIILIEGNGTETIHLADEIITELNSTFSVFLTGLTKGKTYQYASFAKNLAGENRGQLARIVLDEEIDPTAWWVNSEEFAGGWRESDWFGTFLRNSKNDWVYQMQLGWLFIRGDNENGIWMWREQENGWLWTKQAVWPFLWADHSKDWLYPLFLNEGVRFFDYSKGDFR